MSSIHFVDSEWNNPAWDPYPEDLKATILHPMQEQLDPVRGRWNAPMVVTPNGGYRSPEHNLAMSGADASQHVEGKAADFLLPVRGRKLGPVRRAWRVLKFRRLVLRMYRDGFLPDLSGIGAYPWRGFVHLDFFGPKRANGSPRRWWGQAWRRKQL